MDGSQQSGDTREPAHFVWHDQAVAREDRERLAGHRGCVVWLTGLSGCGKSTIACAVDRMLYERGARSFVLDGDNLRHGLNAPPERLRERHGEKFATRFGLAFSAEDREENIRRTGAVAALFCQAGLITLAAFVSPYRRDRDSIRAQLSEGDFIEVLVDAPLSVCEARDPKGLYQKARRGELKQFTGIDDPYEAPLSPELVLSSATEPASVLAQKVVQYLETRGILNA